VRGIAQPAPTGTAVKYEARWDLQNSGVKDKLNSVYFTDVNTGWAAGANNTYAGAGPNRPLRDIHFVNERDGFLLVGSNRPDVVYRTTDGGTRWATIGQLPEARTAMSFPAVDNGWVVGPEGYVVHYHLVPVPTAGK
jgi:hypothetical protein